MQVGIQTISWGVRVTDVGAMLREIEQAGYKGVELRNTRMNWGQSKNCTAH